MFTKILTENFPNLKKNCLFRYRKPSGHQTDLTKIRPPHCILSLKQQAREQTNNIAGCKREKKLLIKVNPSS
jgi:hypothetical protein